MSTKRLGWLILTGLITFKSFAFTKEDIAFLANTIDLNPVNSSFSIPQNPPSNELRLLSQKYLSYFFYDIDFNLAKHYFYKFSVNQYEIAAQVFLLDSKFETIILSHGYLDHAGFNHLFIQFLLSQNYNVIVFDQPGHGLSSGVRSQIDSFSTYQIILLTTFNHFNAFFTQPIHVIGHSTGNVGIIDLLATQSTPWSGKTIMLAPLIRSKLWGTSKFFYKIGGWILPSIPRKFRNNSHNKAFKKWLKKEPFVIKKLSKNWVEAHHEWEKSIKKYGVYKQEFTIIQGQKDSIVDFKFNQNYLIEHFSNLNLIKIPEANHHLINESDTIRKQVFDTVLGVLQDNN
ncbi:alpha/beta hydrolase [Marinicellulosiphila megalodicopiae]|uniref:alpha/beta hydrolase n=1 Tax=Marinicellulosiphila megalodicopiae TaxID=2724896 RepID=UPI003BB0A3C8